MGPGVKRGEVVLVADGMPTPVTLLLCPQPSHLVDAPLYRPVVEPDVTNGLTNTSQFMTDKTRPVDRDNIDKVVGALSAEDVQTKDVALAVILGL